jgi:hypothetical protein
VVDLVKLAAAVGLAFLSTLAAQPTIGTKFVTVEGILTVDGPQMPEGYLQVALVPLGGGSVLSSEVRGDGTFKIGSVIPGHWRLLVNGVYLKSVTRGQRKLSAADIDIGAQAGLPLKIVAGSNFATLRVTTSGQPAPKEGFFVFFYSDAIPDGPEFPVTPDGSGMISPGGGMTAPPGRLLVCAFIGRQPWMFDSSSYFRPSSYFRALRPALERHCQYIEAAEGGEVTVQAVQAPPISAGEIDRLTEKLK